jgi:hypothetical protein
VCESRSRANQSCGSDWDQIEIYDSTDWLEHLLAFCVEFAQFSWSYVMRMWHTHYARHLYAKTQNKRPDNLCLIWRRITFC